jgi:aldehyde:ferredoxin oxidoreductase
MNRMLDEYYALMGWDAGGIPSLEQLQSLGLSELIPPPAA